MKKFLLPLIAVCAGVAPAFADEVYGTTPETAKPFPSGGWFVPDLSEAPAEAWFTITNTGEKPVLWGDPTFVAPDVTDPRQIFVYLCDGGQEAFQMTEDSDTYVLLPNQEYLVKITPKAPGFFSSQPGMPLPDSMKGNKCYYPIDRTGIDPENQETYRGLAINQEPGTTKWYLFDFAYPAQLQFNGMLMMPVMAITSVEAIHIECPGGTNTGSAILPPYVKAGKSVIGVTVSDDFTEDDMFNISLNAMGSLNCSNNLLRGESLALDAETTYPDAYYTVDKYFKVPADGTYTFFNHGAKGTILNVGMVKLTDPDNPYKSECDWTNIKSSTVGNDDAVVVVENLKKDDIVAVQSDAFGVIGKGMEDMPYLKVVKGDQSSISNVASDDNALKDSVVGNTLNVKSVLLASGAEVAVYDIQARKIASAVAPVGAESLDINLDVTAGVYVVVVYGKGNSETAKIVVK